MKRFYVKRILSSFLTSIKVDIPFRFLNRKKCLVIMYHGITREKWDPSVWTQLPEDIFRRQLQFLKAHYNILSLSDFLSAMSSGQPFLERTALITFDDGLKNNYSVAFPLLKEYSVPATIFLSENLIGTKEFLWVDEFFLLLRESLIKSFCISDISLITEKELSKQNLWETYSNAVERLKRVPEVGRDNCMKGLRDHVKLNRDELSEDFGMLTWEQVLEMKQSGLVDFGVHTANHKILTMLTQNEWEEEIKEPKKRLSNILGNEVKAFCYPNGRAGVDFNKDHVSYLKECGYVCAFTTENSLFNPTDGDALGIGRIPAGNDFSSYEPYFRLSTSGLLESIRRINRNRKK